MKFKTLTACLLLGTSLYSQAEPIQIPQYDDLPKARLSSIDCLAVNLYHESRSESDLANIKIISVVLNRVNSVNFPNDICSVVFQPYQFSWTNDNLSDMIQDTYQYERLYRLTEQVLINKQSVMKFSEGSDHYHTVTTKPYWADSERMVYIGTVGNHKFYKRL